MSVVAVLMPTAGAVVTSVVAAGVAWRVAHSRQRGQERAELSAATAAFLAVLDEIADEARRLPAAPLALRAVDETVKRRLPYFNYLMERATRATLLRGFTRIERRFRQEANRLLLVAPDPLLAAVLSALVLLREFQPGSDEWRDQWVDKRNELQLAARAALNN